MHIPLPMQKKEEFQVIFNYNIGKSSPTKMVKKERIWVLISLMDILWMTMTASPLVQL